MYTNKNIWFLYFIVLIIIIISLILFQANRKLFIPVNRIKYIPKTEFKNIFIPIIYNKKSKKIRHYIGRRPYCPCINVWYFDSFKDKDTKTILYFHGNIGNNGHRDYVINICQRFRLNLLLVDYRGFGKSNKHSTLDTICCDAELSYKFLIGQVDDPKKIIVWGESLGGSPAVYIASTCECGYLILLSTFSCLSDVIFYNNEKSKFNKYLSGIVPHLMNNLPNKKWIKNVKCQILIIHSKIDDTIPYRCAEILNEAAKKSRLLLIDGIHGQPKITKEQVKVLLEFCELNLIEFNNDDYLYVSEIIEKTAKTVFD
uniref:Fermentation-respiration switch protein n=1 Tax=Pithovirus LCPAC104 TaxID=2506589 RepID=A0A481Z447_9VIRU|nr:MAG: fermentation-respiration switch protein [Pithovirus LCPAC104]